MVGLTLILIVVFTSQKAASPPPKEIKSENPPNQEDPDDCPYTKESLTEDSKPIDGIVNKRKISDKELEKWKQIPRDYIVKLWKKGYHWLDILQLWEWKLEEKEVPDLKAEKRIGVINKLAVYMSIVPSSELGKQKGVVNNLVVMARKIPSGGPKFTLDEKMVEYFAFKPHNPWGAKKNLQRVINLVFQQENNPSYEFFILSCLGSEYFEKEQEINFGKSTGKSTGSAVVLALLSALHEKPISRSVAATGSIAGRAKTGRAKTVDGEEKDLPAGINLPIAGLKLKIEEAVAKEINRFVLSKYQTTPHLLSLKHKQSSYAGNKIMTEEIWSLKDDYQKEVSSEVKDKIKEINWAENVTELKRLLLENKLS